MSKPDHVTEDEWTAIQGQFSALGRPECVGCGFAITRAYLRSRDTDLVQLASQLPHPDYEHSIWHDPLTENLLVIRPDADGRYQLDGFSPNQQHLR